MKTFTAILAHIGVGAVQAASGAAFIAGHSTGAALGNAGIQLALQAALAALQGVLAHRNSNSDPAGADLVGKAGGGFVS